MQTLGVEPPSLEGHLKHIATHFLVEGELVSQTVKVQIHSFLHSLDTYNVLSPAVLVFGHVCSPQAQGFVL